MRMKMIVLELIFFEIYINNIVFLNLTYLSINSYYTGICEFLKDYINLYKHKCVLTNEFYSPVFSVTKSQVILVFGQMNKRLVLE